MTQQENKAGDLTVSSQNQALFCVSVDASDSNSLSTEAVRRRRDLIEMLEQMQIPSNWTVAGNEHVEVPSNAELTVGVPKSLDRAELISWLRQMSAVLLRDGESLRSVVVDPHEARSQWDVLVRQGCVIARPRTAEVTTDTGARIIRGGLWVAPLSCSFVGGSRRSVRSLFGVCQRKLVNTVSQRKLFHLNVDVGRERKSWSEEKDAIRALLLMVVDQRKKGRVTSAGLGDIPNLVTKKASKPMLSILKAA